MWTLFITICLFRSTAQQECLSCDEAISEISRNTRGTSDNLGEMCKDPGTPGDANQNASSYEIGATLSYACTRTGFKPTGPENYTCEYIGSSTIWSDNLDTVLPTCKDIQKPIYNACQTERQTAFKMQSAEFNVPTFSDNFAIKSVSKTGFARPGDVLTSNKKVTYTANDFNGNSATCSNYIVVSERTKPIADCPFKKIISVVVRTETVYNVSEWKTQFYQEVDAHTTELLSILPESVITDVSKIGSSEEIVVTVGFTNGANVGEEAQCKFRVFYDAGACFEEGLFSDSFSTTICMDNVGGGLECTRTCSNGYVFGNGGTSKTFTCSSPNTWDFDQADPRNRYCLPIQNSYDTIEVQVYYDYDFLNPICFVNFFTNVNVTLKLTLLSSATATEKNTCLNFIRYNSALFGFGNNQLQCGTVTASISVYSADIEFTCRQKNHFKVTSVDLAVDVCVPCGPGLIYNSTSQSCEACPKDQYNGNNMQTTCLSYNTGSYPNVARTNCQVTCPPGYTSTDGFYPCTPCAADSYSANTTTCIQCPNGGSTVGVAAASSEQQCSNPCPEGQYSLSGFMNTECSPCPLHHYQDTPGMTYCDSCPTSHMTLQMGSVNNTFCLLIEGCNSAYCNDRGTCETAFGRKNCQCDVGYYGEQCEDIYHICNGNPCTNGGSCVREDGPMDFTCICVKDYDVCVMETKAEMMSGNSTGLIGFAIVQDKAACEQLCLDDENCIEATFTTSLGGFFACQQFSIEAYLETATVIGTVHMAKHCTTGFTGGYCEVDNIDNCNNSQCHETSRCVDKINDYECFCSSSEGLGGENCTNPAIPCDASPCKHGLCINVDSILYECTCQDGYGGINCDNNIIECEPGTYHVQNSVPVTCTDCPIGTYSTASMVTQCTSCGTGKTTLSTKSTSADACTKKCEPGTYHVENSVSVTCADCPIGTYNTASIVKECTPCATGKTTLATKSTSANACIILDREQSSTPIIIGASVAGGITFLNIVAFTIYRRRKGSRKLPEEEISSRGDNANPGNVYHLPLDTETDLPNTTDEYEVIPAEDVNYYMTLKGDQSPAGPFLDTVQTVDAVSSERNVYIQLDVDRLNDRAKDYQQLNLKEYHDYLVPMRKEIISNINTSNL